jgi:hypothetical protein
VQSFWSSVSWERTDAPQKHWQSLLNCDDDWEGSSRMEWTEAEEQGDSLSLWICALFFVLTSVACGGWRVAGRLGIEVLKYSCVEVSMKI